MDKTEAIHKATNAHQPIRIIYRGGSEPGAERTITPISLDGDRLRARCHVSGAAKVFMLSKIELIPEGKSGPEYTGRPKPKEFRDLESFHDHYLDTLEGFGWIVSFESDEDTACLYLYRRFKNGKPRKTPEMGLTFQKYSDDDTYFDGNDFVTRFPRKLRTRPYNVFAGDGRSGAYGKLDKAIRLLLEGAEEFAPAKG